MKILKITIKNVKGVRYATYEFGDRTLVKGKNGSGKSTILSAFFWLMLDKDVSLVSNPAVRPIDAIDEVVPTVTAVVDFDGKMVEIQKSQKLKRSKSGTISLTNSYMINSVPKSDRDFKEYLTELGVDFDKFLQCTHPNVLFAGINNKKERDALRNMLFAMASDITDKQVAEGDDELFAISELLAHYTVQEIEAMQNATLRKIRENYGKEGEILRAKIEGLESAKVEVDVASINEKVESINKNIDEINEKIEVYQNKMNIVSGISAGLMEKRFRLNQMESDAVAGEIKKRSELEKDMLRIENQTIRLKDQIDKLNETIKRDREMMKETETNLAKNSDVVEKLKLKVFDESTAICDKCGQKLPKKALEQYRINFEKQKTETDKKFQDVIRQQETRASSLNELLEAHTKEVKSRSDDLKALSSSLEEMRTIRMEMGNVPKADMSGNEEYKALAKEIADDEETITSAAVIRDEINSLEEQKGSLTIEIREHMDELLKEKNNTRIDDQIAKLRDEQVAYEQSKANAEMILDQVKTLNMKKNTMLQESVNKHFNLIDFVLFTQQKNGEYKDACIPTINGKQFGQSMNTALEIMAKIDAMCGIQKFFGFDYPILVDDCEHLDSESMKLINTDHQLIMMAVSDDERLVFVND